MRRNRSRSDDAFEFNDVNPWPPSPPFGGTVSEDLSAFGQDLAEVVATVLNGEEPPEKSFIGRVNCRAEGDKLIVEVPGFATFQAQFYITSLDPSYKASR